MINIAEIIEDTLVDTLKLIPFLFIAYLLMEYIENRTSNKTKEKIKSAGKWGPLVGGIVGAFPQCGFSVSATNLYAARVISMGTLIAVYLSTSDEMLPIMISSSLNIVTIIEIIAIKMIIGIIFGFIIDMVFRKAQSNVNEEEEAIGEICNDEHCHCHEDGILKSSITHTMNIISFVLLINFILNIVISIVGEETIATFLKNNIVLGPVISSLIGLIPNCAASVIITNLYVGNVINFACLMAGLLTGAGVGIMVLFKVNKNIKNNLIILALVYGIGVAVGILIQLLGINI